MNRMQVGFPFQVDTRGRIASPGSATHVEELIELVLFTSPGERVGIPSFGCGLARWVFCSSDAERVAFERETLAALDRWLGDFARFRMLDVEQSDAEMLVTVSYTLRPSKQPRQATFRVAVAT